MKNEPGEITIGDSLDWTETLSDYPAPDWVLHYAFFNATDNGSFDAVADGTDHEVVLTSAITGAWKAGRYNWTAYVTKGSEQKTIDEGVFIFKPNPTAGVPVDARSHARKMLEAIEATLESRGTADQLDLVKGQFGERAIERNLEQVKKWRDKYRDEVAAEDSEQAMSDGGTAPKNIHVKFTG